MYASTARTSGHRGGCWATLCQHERVQSGPTLTTTDRFGHELTVGHPDAAGRYDDALGSFLRFADDVVERWDEAVADDPTCAMGQIARAYLRCLSSEGPDAAEAATIIASLGDGDTLTERERAHLDAARSLTVGNLFGAGQVLAALSVEYPRDALALLIGHQIDFFCGDSPSLRDRTGRVLTSWDEHDPWFGYVLGMHAFGLEECGLYPQSEAIGMRALEADARDVWAHHAVMHTYEMQGWFHRGLRFADERRSDWTSGNFFVPHNAWHEALFHLEVDDVAEVLGIYDSNLHHDGSALVALEMLDAASLLWRLHLLDIDVCGRWTPLADAWAEKATHDPWYAFNDMHATMAFVAAGRAADARAVVDRLRAYVDAGSGAPGRLAPSNASMTSDVGLPVCTAIVAFGEGRYDDAVELLLPMRHVTHRFGGSHAQRDVVAQTLLEAAIRSGNTMLATAIASERLAVKESSPYSWLQMARIRDQAADPIGAEAARSRATTLRTAV